MLGIDFVDIITSSTLILDLVSPSYVINLLKIVSDLANIETRVYQALKSTRLMIKMLFKCYAISVVDTLWRLINVPPAY